MREKKWKAQNVRLKMLTWSVCLKRANKLFPVAAQWLHQTPYRESPCFKCITGDSWRAEKVRGQLFCHKRQTNRPVSHISLGASSATFLWVLCCVSWIVSLSPTTSGRLQLADKQIEKLFDTGVLFLCDTLTPVHLQNLGRAGRPAVTVKCEQIVFQTALRPEALSGLTPAVKDKPCDPSKYNHMAAHVRSTLKSSLLEGCNGGGAVIVCIGL